VEAVGGRGAVAAEVAAAVLRTEGGRGVLDEDQAVLRGELLERVYVGRQADLVDEENAFYSIGNSGFRRGDVEVERTPVDVREDRDAAGHDDGVDGGHARVCRNDHA